MNVQVFKWWTCCSKFQWKCHTVYTCILLLTRFTVKPSQVLFNTYFTGLGMYKLNVFNTRKISTEQIIIGAAATEAAKLFIPLNVFSKAWIE